MLPSGNKHFLRYWEISVFLMIQQNTNIFFHDVALQNWLKLIKFDDGAPAHNARLVAQFHPHKYSNNKYYISSYVVRREIFRFFCMKLFVQE